MFFDPKLFNPDFSVEAMGIIQDLNLRRASAIQKRQHISLKMIKGVLDYHGINKEIFGWRMTQHFIKEVSFNNNDDFDITTSNPADIIQESQENHKTTPTQKLSPEEYYSIEYRIDRIVKDKIDERHSEIIAKKRDIDFKSYEFTTDRDVIQTIIRPPFDSDDFDISYRQAVKDSLIKTTGFLRVNITHKNIEETCTETKLNSKGDLVESDFKEKEKCIYTNVERVDPETVFVDALEGKVNEMWCITPLTKNQIIERFNIQEDCFNNVDSKITLDDLIKNAEKQMGLTSNNKLKPNEKHTPKIIAEKVCSYHLGERLIKIYNTKNLLLDGEYFSSSHTKLDFVDKCDGSTPVLLKCGDLNNYYNSYYYGGITPTKDYVLTEYWNKEKNIYIAYIGNCLLYKGRFLEKFRDFPIQPIYTTRDNDNFFGELFSDNLSQEQDLLNRLTHKQELVGLIIEKPFLQIDSDTIDPNFHPDRVLEIKNNSIYNEVHIHKSQVMSGGASPSVISPVQISNYTNDIISSRKAYIESVIERRFPSLKSLTASNPVEVQKEIMYSRDLATNTMIESIGYSLSKFARVVFQARIFEYILKGLYDGNDDYEPYLKGRMIYIDKDLKALNKRKQTVLARLTKTRIDNITKEVESSISKPTEQIQQVIGQMTDTFEQELVKEAMGKYMSAYMEAGKSQEEAQQLALTMVQQDPETQEMIRKAKDDKLETYIKQQLFEMIGKQVPPVEDKSIYLLKNQVTLLENNVEGIRFKFDKSQKELARSVAEFLNMTQMYGNTTKFFVNQEAFFKEACLSNGFNPSELLVEKPPSVKQALVYEQSKLNTFFNHNETLLTTVALLNDMYPELKITQEDLMDSIQKQLDQKTQIDVEKAKALSTIQTHNQMIQASDNAELDVKKQQEINRTKPDNTDLKINPYQSKTNPTFKFVDFSSAN